jgi:hypothetical protein
MLNQERDGPRYKVIFAIRHGEGWHNVKDKQVGRKAWSVGICQRTERKCKRLNY